MNSDARYQMPDARKSAGYDLTGIGLLASFDNHEEEV
jgi:hypothetical protein